MAKDWIILNKQKGQIINWPEFRKMLQGLKDGKYFAEISGADKRSNQQNRYYFGLVVPMIQQGIKDMGTELTKEEVHEWLKSKFNLSDFINTNTGECVSIPISTTRLNKGQFAEYIARIQQFAAEFLSIVIPDPGVQTTMEYD